MLVHTILRPILTLHSHFPRMNSLYLSSLSSSIPDTLEAMDGAQPALSVCVLMPPSDLAVDQ